MIPKKDASQAVRRLIRRHRVVDLEALFEALGTRSRMSVFRRMNEVGYLSSFTHSGRYYTLKDVPTFDELGLWFHRGVGFSRSGTLKATVVEQVTNAPEGRTHAELRELLRVRVHNSLLELVRQRRVRREELKPVHLYVSSEREWAKKQVERRRELMSTVPQAPTQEQTVQILAEALQAAPEIPDVEIVARRCAARGIRVETRQVEQVYEKHGLGLKKKAGRRSSRRSRR